VRGTLSVYSDEPHFFQEKEVALLVKVARDISSGLDNIAREEARRQAELTVRHERDFSDAIVSSLPGVLYLYDESGRFLRWNENFERVTGYSGTEIAGMHPLDFFRSEEHALLTARIGDVFTHGESCVEAGFVSRDGHVTPYQFTGVLTVFAGRKCLIGVGIDLSALFREEEARRASDARYRSLFEYAPDGIAIAGPRGGYVDANASLCRMLGRTREEIVGLSASEFVVPADLVHVDAALTTIGNEQDYRREWLLRRKDGSVFPADVIATKMPDGNTMAIVRDISERKRAEQVLRDAHNTLEIKVQERTQELKSALVRAEAADNVKSAFLATMSHELRTPLNSIIGFTGIVLQGLAGPLNAEQTTQLGMVRSSARHLLELINDVLDISKIEAGQLESRAEAFNLAEAIQKAMASVRPQADARGLALDATLSPQLGEVFLDRRRVEQILLNLLNNAIKFTERGTISLTAQVVDDWRPTTGHPPGPGVRLTVADTGIGIKPEDLVTLFQPFRQIDSGLARQHDGKGLGLAICRGLAALMGGHISAQSQWGLGSTFTVMLPLRQTV
jgi:PAS domain S-box-containing protein